jgi:hypothetical protein
MVRRCAHADCGRQPSYNAPDQIKPLYCLEHKGPRMVNVKSALCALAGCGRQPSYNAPGQKRGLYCLEHKDPGMVDVVNTLCALAGCGRQPSYNAPGQKKGLYCLEHKDPGMVNVVSTLCAHDACGTHPCYNAPGQKNGLYCLEHKGPRMVNVKMALCAVDGCGHRPSYNAPGQKKGMYCLEHKGPEMVSVVRKLCVHEGCGRQRPSYNAPDQKTGLYCKTHKRDGMVSVRATKCQAMSCRETATYGKDECHRAQFCVVHKTATCVCIADAMRCTHEGCVEQYEFVVEAETGTRKVCLAHAPAGFDAALKRLCKWCDLRADVKSECASCRQRMANCHLKEYAVVRHLRRTIGVPFAYDASPAFECTRRRPDIRFETPTHDVIVEVDENQHRGSGYTESCECARICEIVGAIGGKPVVFIRYNPDAVRFGGVVHPVKPAERIDLLVATINEELAREATKFEVRLVQLWYDAPTAGAGHPHPRRETDITDLVAV